MLLFDPQVKFLPFSMATISLQKSALDNVNMDYKGLESTFWAPIFFPDPLEKGSILCHLGLPKWNFQIFLEIPFLFVLVSTWFRGR